MDRIYLDLCCYKRPFDDQADERIQREAAAVASILEAARVSKVALVRSPALALENSRNPREDRRLAAALWFDGAAINVPFSEAVAERARQLSALGVAPLDALHVAFAEAAGARFLGTCDYALLSVAARHRKEFRVEILPPDQVLTRSIP